MRYKRLYEAGINLDAKYILDDNSVPPWIKDSIKDYGSFFKTYGHTGSTGWILNGGVWEDGDFEYGTFKNGVWEKGIFESGYMESCVWKTGYFRNGVFKNSTWENGKFGFDKSDPNKSTRGFDDKSNPVFINSIWKNGIWQSGTFENSIWKNGKWKNGTWKSGQWKGGTWEKGYVFVPPEVVSMLPDKYLDDMNRFSMASHEGLVRSFFPPPILFERLKKGLSTFK